MVDLEYIPGTMAQGRNTLWMGHPHMHVNTH